ncbi:MAG: RICIN domain-containing protein [Saccharothrix sp.]|nr:RICIN domain-containing protein [Saccharothrix sp.]
MIVAAASLLLWVAPASAAGDMRYENVGNPGWCLDGNGLGDRTDAYLHRCGSDFQVWTVGDAGWMYVKHKVSGKCLKVLTTKRVVLGYCGDPGTPWYATGKNGWVKFISNTAPYMCLRPDETWVAGRSTYPLIVDWCDPSNHQASAFNIDGNVPNNVAWRFKP